MKSHPLAVTNVGMNRIFRIAMALSIIASAARPLRGEESAPYLDESRPMTARVDDLLGRLTLEEKVSLVHAESTFSVAGVPRLGIPQLWMDDGPMGVREEVGESFRNLGQSDDFATALPATLGLAATFDTNLAFAYGSVIGQEARQRHKNIMLGPSLNIQRTPLCGRNFEYMGEDPFLTSRMAVNYIEGEQAQGVGSCAKHFAANNQEYQRNRINVQMDERTLREIYLPAFRAAVREAGVLSVMGAYNRLRGEYCCENGYLLNTVLKQEWGFRGIAMSDWGGVHSTAGAALKGMDLEMGTRPPYTNNYLANPFLDGLKAGKFPMDVLDEKVRRHLYVMFKLNLIHAAGTGSDATSVAPGPLSTKEHQQVARQIAEASIVLLKNDHFLPLAPAKLKTVAVIGANAAAVFARGGGAANVKSPFEISALEGISNRLGGAVKIVYAQGYEPPAGRGRRDRGDAIANPSGARTNLIAEAVAAARSADAVIYIGGLNHNGGYDTEGTDRPDMKLPGGQDELLQNIIDANPRTVVVFMGGGAVEMGPWLSKVPAVLYAWYPGIEGGNAVARVLAGDVNPSGKLPCTFPRRLADSPAHALNAYPGTNGVETYAEGLLVGYRWFDTKEIDPLFPFGHGLSYTTFRYSNLKLVKGADANGPLLTVQFDIANTGRREGAEVIQVYVRDVKPTVLRPLKELKAFRKITLAPGAKMPVSIPLDGSALAYYDPARKAWVADAGKFEILVGSSSRDIRLSGVFKLAHTVLLNEL